MPRTPAFGRPSLTSPRLATGQPALQFIQWAAPAAAGAARPGDLREAEVTLGEASSAFQSSPAAQTGMIGRIPRCRVCYRFHRRGDEHLHLVTNYAVYGKPYGRRFWKRKRNGGRGI